MTQNQIILSFTFLPPHLKIPWTSSILMKLKTHKPCLKQELSSAAREYFRKDDIKKLLQPTISKRGLKACLQLLTKQGCTVEQQATTVLQGH